MGGKNRADFRHLLFQVEQSRTAHPFVKMGKRCPFLGSCQDIICRLDDLSAGVAEHDGFDVIPSAGDRIDAVLFPHRVKELILVVFLAHADQDDLRFPGDFPSAETAGDILHGRGFPDPYPAVFVRFLEVRIRLKIRTQKKVIFSIRGNRFLKLARNNGVYPPDLVADFPADFKKKPLLLFRHAFSPLLTQFSIKIVQNVHVTDVGIIG